MNVQNIAIAIAITLLIAIVLHVGHLLFYRFRYRYISYYIPKLKYIYEGQISTPPSIITTFNIQQCDKYIFSVSVWGINNKYLDGCIKLAKQIKEEYPKWKLRAYCNDKLSQNFINSLCELDVQVVIMRDDNCKSGQNSAGMFWRFLPASEPITFISLDTDELIPAHYKKFIENWLNSPEKYMRITLTNHFPWPKRHITGKYWGNKYNTCIDRQLILNHKYREPFGADELFLSSIVYPIAVKEGLKTYHPNIFGKIIYSLCTLN